LLGCRRGELQELSERRRAGVMHRRTHGHLSSFQIETASSTALLEDRAEELVYFARDFLADRFRRFFPESWAFLAPLAAARRSAR